MKKFFYRVLDVVMMFLFILSPRTIESRHGLFREKISVSFKKTFALWMKIDSPEPCGAKFLGKIDNSNNLYFPDLKMTMLDRYYSRKYNKILEFRSKNPDQHQINYRIIGWNPAISDKKYACIQVNRLFMKLKKKLIQSESYEFVLYFHRSQ